MVALPAGAQHEAYLYSFQCFILFKQIKMYFKDQNLKRQPMI